MAVLTTAEHRTIRIAAEFSSDPVNPYLAQKHVRLLARLNRACQARSGFEPVELRYNAVRTRQYVGVIGLGRHSIEVLPKIDAGQNVDETTVRQNLLEMLALTRKLPIRESDAARLARQDDHLLEIVIRLFCEKLFAQAHRGLLNRYETCEDNLIVLRGRLLLNKQLKANLSHRERFFCSFDEFSVDNVPNQVLKAATRIALLKAETARTSTLASQLLFALSEVSDKKVTLADYHRIPRDRTTSRYQELLPLASMLIFGPYLDVVAGKDALPALMFDMARLFEEYLGRKMLALSDAMDMTITLQRPQKWLAEEIFEGREPASRFALRPDIVFKRADRISLIVDTKWKLLDVENVSADVQQADIYQMLAYAKRYSCRDVVLVYPCVLAEQASRVLAKFRIDEINITVAGVDLRDLRTVNTQLRQILVGVEAKRD